MAEQETIFCKWAKERGIMESEMKRSISERIRQGMNDPDPEKQDQWKAIPCAGEMPTPEEWLKYVVEKLKEDGRDDLLQWHSER